MPDLGYIALILALVVGLYSAATSVIAVGTNQAALARSSRNGVLAVFGLVTLAISLLLYMLLSHDFSVRYVYEYTSRDLSTWYILSALYAGNAGSLLFWAWLLSLFATILVLTKRSDDRFFPYTSAVVMLVESFFLILIVVVANPFDKMGITPTDGAGLNPLLENPGMLIHPITLLAGYAGLAIPFAMGVAALLVRRLDDDWLSSIRKWTLVAWLFLGIGNLVGAWWAYVELGWGGYWAWDPVENAGLMPWLLSTALLHSLAMQKRRSSFKIWAMALVILSFDMSIFGTFLTRSNFLSSVHTFGQTGMNPYFEVFLGLIVVLPLGLLIQRRQDLKDHEQAESLVSRHGSFLANNLILTLATAIIFVGTMYPLLSKLFNGERVELGSSFFNQVIGPLFLALIALTGVCAFLGWRKTGWSQLWRRLMPSLVVGLSVALILRIWVINEWYAVVSLSFCLMVVFSLLYTWLLDTLSRRRSTAENPLAAFGKLTWANKTRYGGLVTHLGIAVIGIGVIGSSFYGTETQAALSPGQSMTVENYIITYQELTYSATPDKEVVGAKLSISNGGDSLGQMTPKKMFHRSYEQPVTEVAIRSTPKEDLYVILSGWAEDKTATFKVLVNPLVQWVWIGGGIFLLGALLALGPGRRRSSEEESS